MENENQQSEQIQSVQPLPQTAIPQAPQPVQTPTPTAKPKKSFPIWIILIIFLVLVLMLITAAYFLGTKNSNNITTTQDSNKTVVTSITPTPKPITATDVASWKTYNGTDVSFKYPNNWTPKEKQATGDPSNTSIDIGITSPQVSTQSLEFSDKSINKIDTKDIIQQLAVLIGNKNGFKLIRKGAGYITYDYITNGKNNQGTFLIRVTTKEADGALENQLDQLVASISFTK